MKDLIKKFVNGPLSLANLELRRKGTVPVEADDFERLLIAECGNFSMTGSVRMWALIQSMKYIINSGIDGDFVECGVWKGGNLALMRRFANHYHLQNRIFGYDTFDGMPDATSEDLDRFDSLVSESMKNSPKHERIQNIHAYAGLPQVERNLRTLNASGEITLIKGKVEDTLNKLENVPDKISILRLDTDWYESTKVELEVLYPRLVKGGVLIIDDYGHFKGARKAVDEYFESERIWLHYVDYSCRLMIKH